MSALRDIRYHVGMIVLRLAVRLLAPWSVTMRPDPAPLPPSRG